MTRIKLWIVGSVGLILPVVAVSGSVAGAQPVAASCPPERATVVSLPGAGQNVQVADEVIRELRRLGLSFDHDRIERPYDPKGELC